MRQIQDSLDDFIDRPADIRCDDRPSHGKHGLDPVIDLVERASSFKFWN
jgi:hypothetical protein